MKRILLLLFILIQAPAWATSLTAKWPNDSLLHTTAFWATADRHRGEDPAALSATNPAGRPLIGWDIGPRSMEETSPAPLSLAQPEAAVEDPFPSLPREVARSDRAAKSTNRNLLPGYLPFSAEPMPSARNEWLEPDKPQTYDFPLPHTGWLVLMGLALAVAARLYLARRRRRFR